MADNILKELYILSGIKKLRGLTSYFIFMIKKVEAGSITLDNFMENYVTDKKYIDAYFQTYYDLEQISQEEFNEQEIDTKFIIEEDEETAEAPVYSLVEATFKVEELDNELVTEEFRETSINENYESPGDGYLKLADDFEDNNAEDVENKEVFFDDSSEDVFSLPKSEEIIIKGSDNNNRENKSELLPEESFFAKEDEVIENNGDKQNVLFENGKDITGKEEKESVAEEEEVLNENLADFFEKLDNESTPEEISDDNTIFIETNLITEEVTAQAEEIIVNDVDGETEDALEKKVLEELIPVIPDGKDTVAHDEEINVKTDTEVEEKLQEIEKKTTDEVLNSEFLKYEKHLFESNKLILGLLDDLILIHESKDPDLEMRDAILLEILPLIENLKTESEKMSFEIISGIYESFMFCVDIKFKDLVVSKENIDVFKLSVIGVENLVRGDELKDFDKTIKDIENIQGELNKLLADREDFEKKKYDFGEEESNLIKEFKDSSEYDAYIILRNKITELEDTFRLIAGMKDKTYPFESLRKLSVTFALFREIVNIARILEMNKVAYLAEAGYVFVKFVQNYRIDPFKEEVTEVFKYLIYSFKLIYLDKPVKDFDTFVSFLNDPVKIFYQKNKNR
jgi:hypothetical protein